MSYVTTDGLRPTTKLVLSFWFRIPQVSVDTCAATAEGDDSDLAGIIPLVVFGMKGRESSKTDTIEHPNGIELNGFFYNPVGLSPPRFTLLSIAPHSPAIVDGYDVVMETDWNENLSFETVDFTTHSSSFSITTKTGDGDPTPKSYIGLACGGGTPMLVGNFETNKKGKATNFAKSTEITAGPMQGGGDTNTTFPYINGKIESHLTPFGGIWIESQPGTIVIINDGGQTNVTEPAGSQQAEVHTDTDISNIILDGTGSLQFSDINVTPDHWHHVVLSLELNTMAAHGGSSGDQWSMVDGFSRMFVAVDDKNYPMSDIAAGWPQGSPDPNAVITAECFAVMGVPPDSDGNIATYVLSSPTLPLDGGAVGIPSTSTYVDKILMVEMAAFQMFTGVTLDTSKTGNRRLFITEPNDKRIQKPASRGLAVKALGQPSVKFFSAGECNNPKIFDHVGEIDPYTPNANLGGKQGT